MDNEWTPCRKRQEGLKERHNALLASSAVYTAARKRKPAWSSGGDLQEQGLGRREAQRHCSPSSKACPEPLPRGQKDTKRNPGEGRRERGLPRTILYQTHRDGHGKCQKSPQGQVGQSPETEVSSDLSVLQGGGQGSRAPPTAATGKPSPAPGRGPQAQPELLLCSAPG